LTDPKVSAAIPVRNGERFLAQAIESALSQTVSCCEVIVVDNGSSDGSRRVAERYADDGVRILDEPERGTARARNAALAAYRGSHLAFLDADDCWEVNKNEIQLAALGRPSEGGEAPDVVFGQVVQFREGEDGYSPPQPGLLVTSLAARATWDQLGPWPPEVGNSAEGLDWLLRVRRAGLRELMLDDIVLRRRIHGENVGFRERDTWGDMAHVVKRELDRRRAGLR
jgi:glycosyltransferase involved in cell wall biosynthesis